MLNGFSFFRTAKEGKLIIIKAAIYDNNNAIESKDWKEQPLEALVPKQYHACLQLLSTILVDLVPPDRAGIDHEVQLDEWETPLWGLLCSMSEAELVVLTAWLKENP